MIDIIENGDKIFSREEELKIKAFDIMENDSDRYYHKFNSKTQNYDITDRSTDTVIETIEWYCDAEKKVKELMEKHKEAMGIPKANQIEIPSSHTSSRYRSPAEVEKVVVHK